MRSRRSTARRSGTSSGRSTCPQGQIEKALKLLEVDGAVAREGQRYFRTPNPWHQDEERIAGVIAARRSELASMQAYMATDECRMAFLARLLDDPAAHVCGHCANDGGRVWPREVDEALVIAAIEAIRGDAPVIEPRKQAPDAHRLAHPNEPGRALCHYGDAGWGRRVARGKYELGRFDDELVEASAALVRDRWLPEPSACLGDGSPVGGPSARSSGISRRVWRGLWVYRTWTR